MLWTTPFWEAHSLICKTSREERTYNFEFAKFTEWQSWKAHWDQPMEALHFTGPQS